MSDNASAMAVSASGINTIWYWKYNMGLWQKKYPHYWVGIRCMMHSMYGYKNRSIMNEVSIFLVIMVMMAHCKATKIMTTMQACLGNQWLVLQSVPVTMIVATTLAWDGL